MGPAFERFVVCYLFWVPWDRIGLWARERLREPKKHALLYDGDCGLCEKTVAILGRLDLFRRIDFYDAMRDWARAHDRFPSLRQEDCLEEMHVVTARGNVYRGFDAYRALAWAMPATFIVAPFLYVPGVPWVGRRVYAAVAARRDRSGCPVAPSGYSAALGTTAPEDRTVPPKAVSPPACHSPAAVRCRTVRLRRGCPRQVRGGAGDRPDVGEHAAGVPGWEGSDERRGAVELDAAPAGGLGPGELPGVPFDEGFGFHRDVEVPASRPGYVLQISVSSQLDDEPIAFTARAADEVEADDDASIREPGLRGARWTSTTGPRMGRGSRGDLEPTRTPLAERLAEEFVATGRELVVVPAPAGLGCRLDDAGAFVGVVMSRV